ncbi:hypothetical protein Tco_0091842, partial [Tanacetum coccineum]
MEETEEMEMEETEKTEMEEIDTEMGIMDSALTWWNSHKRTIGVEAAYAMNWVELMKLMTEVYCPRNEIQRMETELMVPDEEDRVERFIGGLPDNIQGNVIAANSARIQDDIRIANQLMDKKVQCYATRSVENKRRMESNLRDNRGHQPPFKMLHHEGLCTVENEAMLDINKEITRDFQRYCPRVRIRTWKPDTKTRMETRLGKPDWRSRSYGESYAIGVGGTNPDSNLFHGMSVYRHKLRPRKAEDKSKKHLRTYPIEGNFLDSLSRNLASDYRLLTS